MVGTADFTGKWLVATNNFTQLTPYITRYELVTIHELFGKELGDLFVLDEDAAIWDDLKLIGFGLKSLLTGIIYVQYVRDLPYRVTNMGVVYQIDENSNQVMTALVLRQRYNECVKDWNEMGKYLGSNFDAYKGITKQIMID